MTDAAPDPRWGDWPPLVPALMRNYACWSCLVSDHHDPHAWHTWANDEDIHHAASAGLPDPSSQQCNCWCAANPHTPTEATTPAAQTSTSPHLFAADPTDLNNQPGTGTNYVGLWWATHTGRLLFRRHGKTESGHHRYKPQCLADEQIMHQLYPAVPIRYVPHVFIPNRIHDSILHPLHTIKPTP